MSAASVTEAKMQDSLQVFEEVAALDYKIPFAEVLCDSDTRRRRARVGHITGVVMKKRYSTPTQRRRAASPTGVDIRWKIDEAELLKTREDYWSLRVLSFAPGRQADESPRELALRFPRETQLWSEFRGIIRNYICSDPATLRKVKDALKAAGLDPYAGMATPKGLLQVGALNLAAVLGSLLPPIGAVGISVAVIVVGTLGLSAICSSIKGSRKKGASRGTESKGKSRDESSKGRKTRRG